MSAALYEVLNVEARTGVVIDRLPVTGISYGETLNASGAASVGVPLSAREADPDILSPGASGLVILRDDEPVWGGMLWTASADLDSGTLTLNASGWHSYYSARYLDMPGGYDSKGKIDQAMLLQAWIGYANDNGGIGTDTSRLTTTGRVRSRAWGFPEFKNIAEAINELADEDGGFDFRYSTFERSNGTYGSRILKSARLENAIPSALVHRENCNVTQVGYDGSKLATRAYAFGADLGTGVKPYASSTNDLDTPALTQVVTYSDLKATGDLVPKAGAVAAMGRQVIGIPTLTLYPGVFEPSGFLPGSVGTVQADSGYVRLLEDFVLTERRVDVDVNGTESVALSLASKEVFTSGDSS
ncbi:minor tail protein [Streptomyces phage Heather]|uniref:Minor tail protein n=1 Tax=Streptomyces phage Heather TaxID=2562343 RepID=A0A4D6E5J9_9CAUD|nr:minor tail protein [Streptomyces phage Heather]